MNSQTYHAFFNTLRPDGYIISSIFGHLQQRKFALYNKRFTKVGKIVAKMAKFRPIWSH